MTENICEFKDVTWVLHCLTIYFLVLQSGPCHFPQLENAILLLQACTNAIGLYNYPPFLALLL